MGKIKGWTKSNEKNLWNHGETINQSPDGYLKIHEHNNNYFIMVKKPKLPEQRINYRMIYTQQDAVDYAMKYMRSHPNG